jgi:hypothetical protein
VEFFAGEPRSDCVQNAFAAGPKTNVQSDPSFIRIVPEPVMPLASLVAVPRPLRPSEQITGKLTVLLMLVLSKVPAQLIRPLEALNELPDIEAVAVPLKISPLSPITATGCVMSHPVIKASTKTKNNFIPLFLPNYQISDPN